LTDPVGNTTSWSYNFLGLVSREEIVQNGVRQNRYFYYDGAGNIIRKFDRNSRVTEWTYDGFNRHKTEIWYDTINLWLQKKPSKQFTTTYNNRGKLEFIDDGNSKFTFTYGIFGNKIKEVQKLSGFEKPIEFNFVTNINGLNTEKILKVDGQIDHTNKYEFDPLNRTTNITQIANNSIKSANIQHDNFGQLAKQSRFDSSKLIIETKNKFDEIGRLTNISHSGNNKTYADYDLTWDAANRITDFDFTYLNGPAKKNESKLR
jgi:YD repeat-containing protein